MEEYNNPVELDVIIIGAGMAGLTAATYTARGGLSCMVFENALPGGQINQAAIVENYPSIKSISGAELASNITEQALGAGAKLEEFEPIERVDLSKKMVLTKRQAHKAKAIIIATGSSPKPLAIENEAELKGKGVHYCAFCDGAFYKGKTISVIGGGNSALEGAIYLSSLCYKVIMVIRRDIMRGEAAMIERARAKNNIEFLFGRELSSVSKNDNILKLSFQSGETLDCDGIFSFIGEIPNTSLFSEILLTPSGHIITDEHMKTSIDGVFAVGDVREKTVRQLTTAAADGTIAAVEAAKYINSMER